MDDNFRELEREAFEATFDGKAEDAGKPEGYGLDPRQAEMEAMAAMDADRRVGTHPMDGNW